MEDLLKELIKFKTVSDDQEFVKCITYIKEYLKDTKLYLEDYLFNGKRSLVISNTVSNNLDIIFCGHLDVVPGNDNQFNPVIKKGKMYGRGTYDMKGHDAVMIEIMKNLNTSYKVALFLTCDEEQGGFNGTNKLLNEIGYTSRLAIVPDAGNNFQLVTEEKGVLQIEITIKGTPAHSSCPWNGDNAIIKLMEIYNKIIKKYPMPKDDLDYKTSVNLGYIKGGDAINRVAGSATMGLDIRHTLTDTKADILKFIHNLSSDTIVNVLKEGIEFAYLENDLSKKYLSCAEKVLGHAISLSKCASSSDARFFYEKGISTVLMNAEGFDMHGDNEYIILASLNKLYEIYERMLSK